MKMASQFVKAIYSFDSKELERYIKTCPYRYKTYQIKKRGGGTRTISQPSKDLKIVQKLVIQEFLQKDFLVHSAAKAYKVETSIIDNAKVHRANRYLLKMDFSNFFESITGEDFRHYLISNNIVDDFDEVNFLINLFFKSENGRMQLSVGSPGSPLISNALLYEFDTEITKLAKTRNVSFSRYSDDLTFSTNTEKELFYWPELVAERLRKIKSPTLKLNPEKTVFSSKRFNRHVTGIVITNEGELSIGRNRKRRIKSQVYRANELSEMQIRKLQGHISFACQVEPDFWNLLSKKYPKQMVKIFPNRFEKR